MLAAAGPPWTTVTIGALPAAGAVRGASSHPWTVYGPLCQLMLRAVTSGAQASLSWLIWRDAAAGPAKIAGACSKSWRTKARVLPSADRAILASPAAIEAASDQVGVAGPRAGSSGTTSIWSPTSAEPTSPARLHSNDVNVPR